MLKAEDILATAELVGAELGAARRERRLVRVVEALVEQPEGSVPQAMETWTATKGAYRFWDLDTVTPEAIRGAALPAVLGRVQQQERMLMVHDTTGVAIQATSTHGARGPLRRPGQRGVVLHSAMAMSIEGVPPELPHQAVWTRDPAETGKTAMRRQQPIEAKESLR